MKYDKEHIKSDGRKLVRGGPRDLQRRQAQGPDQTVIVEELRKEIQRLSVQPTEASVVKGYTGEQVDEEVRKAVAVVLEEVQGIDKGREKELLDQIKSLETDQDVVRNELNTAVFGKRFAESRLEDAKKLEAENKKITELIEKQNAKMEELTYALQNAEAQLELESDRPKIETTFIDPLERNAGKDLKPHIKIEDVKGPKKEKMKSSVEKLKGLMDKLPNNG